MDVIAGFIVEYGMELCGVEMRVEEKLVVDAWNTRTVAEHQVGESLQKLIESIENEGDRER